MARLRIRIELNRGGVGVPLHKLASVVNEAQKFFHLLADDVHIDKGRGEWLGFDFDHESLNFTAEYVGPVTAEQVQAFYAAFDGTTSLRRGTIAQFARITDAIGEDELIGFGLYQSDDGAEPNEWRCLSRRDALRIAEEIQLLAGATEELDQSSHLPAVRDSIGTRLFGERRDRHLEQGKWVDYVREVETSLTERLTRVENKVEKHSGVIQELGSKSAATEESFRNLLSAVENFCDQATHQIERISPPTQALLPAPAAPRKMFAAAVAGAIGAGPSGRGKSSTADCSKGSRPGSCGDVRAGSRGDVRAGYEAVARAGYEAVPRAGYGAVGRADYGADGRADYGADGKDAGGNRSLRADLGFVHRWRGEQTPSPADRAGRSSDG